LSPEAVVIYNNNNYMLKNIQ